LQLIEIGVKVTSRQFYRKPCSSEAPTKKEY